MFYEEHQEAYLQRGDTGASQNRHHGLECPTFDLKLYLASCDFEKRRLHSTETPHLAPYCAPILQLSVAQTCREVYQSWIRYKWPRTEGNLPENHRTMEWLLDARNPVKVDWRAENIREEFVGVALTRWRGVGASGGGGKKRGGVLSKHETLE
ncbi:hypothetical protein B0H13DRAFT_2145757 [Mycena leptocephala]|nr:hypothetical protein B0H13DRAFT_2145757 [Mycena leptocephala]